MSDERIKELEQRMEELESDLHAMTQAGGNREVRLAALEQWMTQFTLDNHGRVLPSAEEMDSLEKRLAAVEELLKPVSPEVVEISRSERSILFAPVLFEKAEIEGLDLPGFKSLLREKLQKIGDELVTAFLKR